MNFFSSDVFLSALAEVYFPGRPHHIGLYACAGRVLRLLRVAGRPPLTSWPFLDALEPLDNESGDLAGRVRFAPQVVLATHEITRVPDGDASAPGFFPAPFIEWNRFADWGAFERHFAARRASLVRDSRAKHRHLAQELGPVCFVYHDPRPEVFARCLAWKSAQYARQGLIDLFAVRANARLFQVLAERGVLVVSSLAAGETLLAVHFGARQGTRFYSWIAAYDPAHARHSPGRLLLEALLRECQGRGQSEFDFGPGGMEYKWHYATHQRVIGPLGRPPLALRLRRTAREKTRRLLAHSPRLLAGARRLALRLRQRHLRRLDAAADR